MNVNSLPRSGAPLGEFLRDRRSRLRPEADAARRRRTPGLRREEVAARAGVSVTWYTWLEQGRGGPPSAHVLERLAHALELDPAAREVLFLLAQNRPPPVQLEPAASLPDSVQAVLDALQTTPAFVKTRTWDVVAWNDAASVLLADYAALPPHQRNVLRRLFCEPDARRYLTDWEAHARYAVSVFRYDIARVGGTPEADALVAELEAISPEFARLWAENEVRGHGVGLKHFLHPDFGGLTLEITGFSIDSVDGYTMIVFTPASPEDAKTLKTRLLAGRAQAPGDAGPVVRMAKAQMVRD
jgi:transcriptional regulator with XRE-family HTH domain